MTFRKILVSAVLLMTAIVAAAQTQQHHAQAKATAPHSETKETKLPSQQTVESFLHALVGFDPADGYRIQEIKPAPFPGMAEVDVVLTQRGQDQLVRLYITPDGEHAIAGEVMPFGADPYLPARRQLEKAATGPARGASDNKLLLVEFSDLQCPHCKAAQPVIAKLLEDFPKARFVFQHFPLPMHPWAFKAASYAQCIGERDNTAFFKYVDLVFDNQGTISPEGENADATLKDLAKQVGANPDQIATCAADAGTAENVKQSIALGRELGVQGTPTLYVNGRPVEMGKYSYEIIKSIVAFDAVR